MFRLEMLPACEGDCLILSWGDNAQPRRILIDGGRKPTAASVLDYATRNSLRDNAFELFVITHIDRDHIEGAVELLKEPRFRSLVTEVWFNGREDLEYAVPRNDFEKFGALDGERLTELLAMHNMAWNSAFDGGPVAVLDETVLPTISLPDGLTITILSPDGRQLQALAEPWDETIVPAGWELLGEDEPLPLRFLAETKFKGDRAKPNGSSIAMVAECGKSSVLLSGDAHVPRLIKSISTYIKYNPAAHFMAVKASHHGSRGNTSLELVRLLDCPLWLFSTSGAQFGHPDQEAVARVVWGNNQPTKLAFNYRTEFSELWERRTSPATEIECQFGDGCLSVEIPVRV